MSEGRYAVVVATSRYLDPQLRRLTSPRHDATEFADVLADPEIGRFQVTPIRDKDAHVVETEIDRILGEREPDDTVLLYFSGHGLKDDSGNLYLAARNTSRALLRSTGVSDTFLREVMRSCRARRQVLILDCCFGGAFAKGLLAKADQATVEVTERLQGQGRVILTASNAMEWAFEGDGVVGETRLSVFTRMLVQGLRSGEADADGDGQVSVQDLYDYAFKRIAIPGAKQTPTMSTIGQEGSIFVARVPKNASLVAITQPLVASGHVTVRRLDLRPWVRVRDTGPEASGAAVAAVTALETFFAARGKDVRLSPRYVYQKAKQLQGSEPGSDGGIDLDVLVRVLNEHGAPPESAWPYKPGAWKLPRGISWAELDELAMPYRARLLPVTRRDEIATSLTRRRPVLAAFNVFESTWLGPETAGHGVIEAPRDTEDPFVGTAIVTIVDLDPESNVLRFAHTWGRHWGARGIGEMSIETAKVLLSGDEMWAVDIREASFSWTSDASADVPAPTVRAAEPGGPRRAVYDGRNLTVVSSLEPLPAKALARVEGAPATGDPAVDETYAALGAFHRFWRDVFARDSWDGKGGQLEAVVHYGREFDNAFWDGRRVFIGDPGGSLRSLYRVEIVAKECSFGLLESEVELLYQGETGALMQSLSVVFAMMVTQYVRGEAVAKSNWLYGEGVREKGGALQSLDHPGTAYDHPDDQDPQVGHMTKLLPPLRHNDIYVNTGIPNRAFALVAKALGGHSWERAGRIWYESIRGGRLRPTSTFRQFARRTVTVATKLYPNAPEVRGAVRGGWSEVGVTI